MTGDRNILIRVPDQEALTMLDVLAAQDLRNMGTETAWLIRQEFARRQSQPNPVITVEDAQKVQEATK
jgi:hypothetical protein